MCKEKIYFTEPVTGLRLRIRLDAYHPDISFDLKTTRHAKPEAFARDAVDLGYDLQAFMYSLGRWPCEGTLLAPFVFIAADTSEPHSIGNFDAGATFLENGAAKLQSCLATFKARTEPATGRTSAATAPWRSRHRSNSRRKE